MSEMNFKSVLYLDDNRVPLINGIQLVKNYDQFVDYIEEHGVPDLISFDHDLDPEHYPIHSNNAWDIVPYETYKEKTGYHCVLWMAENNIFPKYWRVHTMNAAGRLNIEGVLRRLNPDGELLGLQIPYRIVYF